MRIVVVDDSAPARRLLVALLSRQPDLDVVAEGTDGAAAVRLVRQHRPDLLLMDVQMPRLAGVDAAARVMRAAPLPIVLVTASEGALEHETPRALAAGALAVLPKPPAPGVASHDAATALLLRTLRLAAGFEVGSPQRRAGRAPRVRVDGVGAVGVTGGRGSEAALARILSALPPAIGARVLVSVPAADDDALAEWLASVSRLPVALARHLGAAGTGVVTLAPARREAVLTGTGRVRLLADRDDRGDRMLASIARACGGRCMAVVLSGDGSGGLDGAKAVAAAGGLVVAQDPATAAAPRLPAGAVANGAAAATPQRIADLVASAAAAV